MVLTIKERVMRANVEKFLTFCDKHNLSFDIKYREDFRDPESRFYLTFGSYHQLKIMGRGGILQDFSFADGNTPNEALEQAIRKLKGCYVQFKGLQDSEHVTKHAVFR
jgi:hypothetical protein